MEQLRKDANVTRSCAAVGICTHTYYDHKKTDEEFSKAADESINRGIDACIDECRRRAFIGCLDDVYYEGSVVGQRRVFSDSLAMFLIKGQRPEYKDKLLDVPPNGSFELKINTTGMPDGKG